MDPLTIISLIVAAARAAQGLGEALGRLHTGQELTDADRELIKRQQAAAEADFDAALQLFEVPGLPPAAAPGE